MSSGAETGKRVEAVGELAELGGVQGSMQGSLSKHSVHRRIADLQTNVRPGEAHDTRSENNLLGSKAEEERVNSRNVGLRVLG